MGREQTAVALLAVFLIAGCADPREKAVARMHAIGPDRLRKDAALLYKNLFASTAPTFTVLKTDRCPESFRAMAPLSIGAYADGFSLSIEHEGGTEAGLYVVPLQMDLQPASRGRARFEQIVDGIYWYSFRP